MWLSELVRREDAGSARRAARPIPSRLSGAGDRADEGPYRSDLRPVDGPDGGEPRVSLRHHAARDGRVCRAQPPARAGGAKAGHFDHELVPLYDRKGKLYAADDGVREDSTAENLAKLRPFFDRKYGNVTAGNSSQITDGGAWVVVASARAVEEHKLTPIGRIVDSQWAGLDPAQMGLGPVHAATPILQRHNLGLNDLDAWEINEAFAAQVIALRARVGERRLLPYGTRTARRAGPDRRRQAQRRRRRDRARPSGRAHRARASSSTC